MYSASNAFLSLRYRTVFQYDVFCVTVLKAKDFPIPIFYLFIYLFVCLFMYLFICLFIYLFIFALRLAQKTVQLPLFSFLCSFLRQIWTGQRKLFVEFSTFVELEKCGLIRIDWRNVLWQIFSPIWNFVWKIMPCALLCHALLC